MRALITGITGQDGSYLAEWLLEQGAEVHGVVRRASTFTTLRIDHLYEDPQVRGKKLHLHYGDLSDPVQISGLIGEVQPDHVYNLGAQSHVRVAFDIPEYTGNITGLGTARLLEALRKSGRAGSVRYYQASSAEIFGVPSETPQTERTPLRPASPSGCAKAYAHLLTETYRDAYGLHASNGILFNHESPRRGPTFVTRKITRAAARIKLGLQDALYLGDLDARRDWGHAADYVRAMWLMLAQDSPGDYVIATGETHSVRDFCREAFGLLDLDYKEHVRHDPRYKRPREIAELRGDATKARRELGWEPRVRFRELVRLMVDHDLAEAKRELAAAKTFHLPIERNP